MNIDGYTSEHEYVSDQLDIARLRLERTANLAQLDLLPAHAQGRAALTAAVEQARVAIETAVTALNLRIAKTSTRFPALHLRDRLALAETEEAVVWLLAAIEIDPGAAALRGLLEPTTTSGLTLGTLRRSVYGVTHVGAAWRELSSGGRLHRLAIVETDGNGTWSFTAGRSLRIAPAVLGLVHGVAAVDRGIARAATLRQPSRHGLVADAALVPQIVAAIASGTRLVMVSGSASIGRTTALITAAAELGHRVLEIDVRRLPVEMPAAESALRRIARDCATLDHIPLLANIDTPRGESMQAWFELVDSVLLAEVTGPVFATASAPVAHAWSQSTEAIEMRPLAGRLRAQLWRRVVPAASESDADIMAERYPLAAGLVVRAGELVNERVVSCVPTPEDIAGAVATVVDRGMAGLATRVEVTQRWEDIVLAEEQAHEILELVGRIRGRGRVYEDWGMGRKVGRGLGIAALLSGPPGTGKTMVAGLIADEVGLELYRVDLAKVVSKWVGETEKQLAALFDAAEAANVVLLFDEADALFTRRTSVSSSNDRYANLEVNYLLQRLESFTGICLLTTNHDQAIDPAFRRRLAQHIRFDEPDEAERIELWRRILPPEVPIEGDIDSEKLASCFKLSGGYIRNAALRATFAAADAGRPLTMNDLVTASIREYESMGRLPPSTLATFGQG